MTRDDARTLFIAICVSLVICVGIHVGIHVHKSSTSPPPPLPPTIVARVVGMSTDSTWGDSGTCLLPDGTIRAIHDHERRLHIGARVEVRDIWCRGFFGVHTSCVIPAPRLVEDMKVGGK